jgi:serine/threonine-protein kinase
VKTPALRRLGKYEILETLGSGAMGAVHLAYDPVIDRRVAVKTIHRHTLDAVADAAERFRREASAAGRLNHPGIVAVYDYGEDEDVAFIVMEYAPGLQLDLYVAQQRPTLQQLAGLMTELLDALGYAHAAGVVHRDVKPGNILVAGRLKIADFGIARIDNVSQTETGVAVGTPAYMAPEQFMGKEVDHRVDLFAVGVILYELLTGRRPFDGRSLEELSYKICHAAPFPATSLIAGLPPAIDAVLTRALAKAKTDRFASAAEMSCAICDALAAPPGAQAASGVRRSQLSAGSAHAAAKLSWSPDLLQQLEQILTPIIGSVARVSVRRSAARAASPSELLQLISESLESEPLRPAIVERLRSVLGGRNVSSPSAAFSRELAQPPIEPILIAPEAIARVTLALADSLGPIAKLLTRQAAQRSNSYLELCLHLSERLSTEEEKARFLKEVGVS